MPDWRAFRDEDCLPSRERGPVESCALRRLASICLRVAMSRDPFAYTGSMLSRGCRAKLLIRLVRWFVTGVFEGGAKIWRRRRRLLPAGFRSVCARPVAVLPVLFLGCLRGQTP